LLLKSLYFTDPTDDKYTILKVKSAPENLCFRGKYLFFEIPVIVGFGLSFRRWRIGSLPGVGTLAAAVLTKDSCVRFEIMRQKYYISFYFATFAFGFYS
jgi:hypothetical protein